MYTMMQVCRQLDMTYQTLKYYCNEGLIPNVKRDSNNRRIFDEKDVKKIGKKIRKGNFNFNDFINQLESVKKLGNMKNLIGMIPGMNGIANQIKDMDLENSKEIIHIKAMINSMTPDEREDPNLLNNARKRRIASGAGLSQVEVNKFLKQFLNASKIAKRFSGKGGMQNLSAMLHKQNFPR